MDSLFHLSRFISNKFTHVPVTFLDKPVGFNCSAIAVSKTTLDHTDIVCAILVESAAVAHGLAVGVLTLLDCIIICDNTDYSVRLVGSTLELSYYSGVVEDFLSDIDLFRIKVQGLITLL